MIGKILVAIDGSEHGWRALDLAADIAKQHGAQLTLLHVVPYEPTPEALRAFTKAENIPFEEEAARFRYARNLGDHLTRSAEARVRDRGLTRVSGRTREGKPADVILETAKSEGADMIVMGSRGLSDPQAFMLGSVSHKVAHRAECTCVTVK